MFKWGEKLREGEAESRKEKYIGAKSRARRELTRSTGECRGIMKYPLDCFNEKKTTKNGVKGK